MSAPAPSDSGQVALLPLLVVAALAFGAGSLWGPWRLPGPAAPATEDAAAASETADAGTEAAADHDALAADPEPPQVGLPAASVELLAAEAEIRRLRQQLIEKEQRVEALMEAMGKLRAATDDQDTSYASVSRTSERMGDPTLLDLNAALREGGVADMRVLELDGHGVDEVLGLLVSLPAREDGLGGVQRWERGFLAVQVGVPRFVLERQDPEDEQSTQRVEVEVRGADRELFALAGLPLAEDQVLVEDAAEALRGLLAAQSLQLLSLGGVRGVELLDLVLLEFDPQGVLLRRLEAGRAQVLSDGPTLLLQDGEVIVDGESRPFYRGTLRLPLPGAPYADWLTSLFG
jgi:HAMP domain-containing protein